jgi:hypothetical protein
MKIKTQLFDIKTLEEKEVPKIETNEKLQNLSKEGLPEEKYEKGVIGMVVDYRNKYLNLVGNELEVDLMKKVIEENYNLKLIENNNG